MQKLCKAERVIYLDSDDSANMALDLVDDFNDLHITPILLFFCNRFDDGLVSKRNI